MDDEAWQSNLEHWRHRRREATKALAFRLAASGQRERAVGNDDYGDEPSDAIREHLRQLKREPRRIADTAIPLIHPSGGRSGGNLRRFDPNTGNALISPVTPSESDCEPASQTVLCLDTSSNERPTVRVRLSYKPDCVKAKYLGITVISARKDEGPPFLVHSIAKGSMAENSQLRVGDEIYSIDNVCCTYSGDRPPVIVSLSKVLQLLDRLTSSKRAVEVRIIRGGQTCLAEAKETGSNTIETPRTIIRSDDSVSADGIYEGIAPTKMNDEEDPETIHTTRSSGARSLAQVPAVQMPTDTSDNLQSNYGNAAAHIAEVGISPAPLASASYSFSDRMKKVTNNNLLEKSLIREDFERTSTTVVTNIQSNFKASSGVPGGLGDKSPYPTETNYMGTSPSNNLFNPTERTSASQSPSLSCSFPAPPPALPAQTVTTNAGSDIDELPSTPTLPPPPPFTKPSPSLTAEFQPVQSITPPSPPPEEERLVSTTDWTVTLPPPPSLSGNLVTSATPDSIIDFPEEAVFMRNTPEPQTNIPQINVVRAPTECEDSAVLCDLVEESMPPPLLSRSHLLHTTESCNRRLGLANNSQMADAPTSMNICEVESKMATICRGPQTTLPSTEMQILNPENVTIRSPVSSPLISRTQLNVENMSFVSRTDSSLNTLNRVASTRPPPVTPSIQSEMPPPRPPRLNVIGTWYNCAGCNQQLGASDLMIVEQLSLFYHLSCFVCARCGIQLSDGQNETAVRIRHGFIYCYVCYHRTGKSHDEAKNHNQKKKRDFGENAQTEMLQPNSSSSTSKGSPSKMDHYYDENIRSPTLK